MRLREIASTVAGACGISKVTDSFEDVERFGASPATVANAVENSGANSVGAWAGGRREVPLGVSKRGRDFLAISEREDSVRIAGAPSRVVVLSNPGDRRQLVCVWTWGRAGCHIGAEIRGFDEKPWFNSPKSAKQQDRYTHLAVAAAKLAVDDAGLKISASESQRHSLFLGTTGRLSSISDSDFGQFERTRAVSWLFQQHAPSSQSLDTRLTRSQKSTELF